MLENKNVISLIKKYKHNRELLLQIYRNHWNNYKRDLLQWLITVKDTVESWLVKLRLTQQVISYYVNGS